MVGFIAVWEVANDGSLSKNFTSLPTTAGVLVSAHADFELNFFRSEQRVFAPFYKPFGLALIPGQEALIASDPAIGATTLTFGSSNIRSVTSKAIPIPGQKASCWVERSTKTGAYYVVDAGTSTITEITLDDATIEGKIVKQYQLANKSVPIDEAIATINGNE